MSLVVVQVAMASPVSRGTAVESLRPEFSRIAREQAADRNINFLLLGGLLIVLFTLFDLIAEQIPSAVLRTRLSINLTTLVLVTGLATSLRYRWVRQRVYELLFLLCAGVVVVQVYALEESSVTLTRLAFHYLLILGLSMITIQWPWWLQLGLGTIAVCSFVEAVGPNTPDFAFFIVALVGGTLMTTVIAAVLRRSHFEQFVAEARLRHANQIKDEFLSTMSHELRTPLNIIVGYSDLLEDEGVGALSAEQHNVVVRIRGASLHLLSLVESTLNVSRLEAGRIAVEIQSFSLDEVVDELRQGARLLPGAHRLPVIWEGPTGAVHVATDQLKLKEIVLNLVANAVKFTKRGEIRVRVEVEPKGLLTISVKDTGTGIPADSIPTIFESFRQLNSGNGAQHGVGLGLYIVKKLVDLLQGSIEVQSTVGVGSEFLVRLPVRVEGASNRVKTGPVTPAAGAAPISLERRGESPDRGDHQPGSPHGTIAAAPGQ